jgi:phytoene dehydrogenase-like protein
VEELFQLAGEDPSKQFDYEKLEVACHYFWEDGIHLKAYAEPLRFADEVANLLGESRDRILEALKQSAFLYQHLAPLFMHKSLHKWQTWVGPKALSAYLKLGKLGIFPR